MKVIVATREFQDFSPDELVPSVFSIRKNETPEQALQRVWSDVYANTISDANSDEVTEAPVDEANSSVDGCYAVITWQDGDCIRFYIADMVSL